MKGLQLYNKNSPNNGPKTLHKWKFCVGFLHYRVILIAIKVKNSKQLNFHSINILLTNILHFLCHNAFWMSNDILRLIISYPISIRYTYSDFYDVLCHNNRILIEFHIFENKIKGPSENSLNISVISLDLNCQLKFYFNIEKVKLLLWLKFSPPLSRSPQIELFMEFYYGLSRIFR